VVSNESGNATSASEMQFVTAGSGREIAKD